MVLYEGRAGDDVVEVGVVAAVVGVYAESLGGGEVVGSAEHVEVFVGGSETYASLVGNLKSAARPLAGGDDDDTRGTARPVLSGLGGILEYGETLDVAGVEGREGGDVGGDAVDDDQRVVAAHDGGCTTHADAIEHGHAVDTVGGDAHTGGLAVEHVEGILGDTSGLLAHRGIEHAAVWEGSESVGLHLWLVRLLGDGWCYRQCENVE